MQNFDLNYVSKVLGITLIVSGMVGALAFLSCNLLIGIHIVSMH